MLVLKFSPRTMITLRLAFPCPLNLTQSKFEPNANDDVFTMILTKDMAELISLTSFSQEMSADLFDSTTAKRWPPPGLANGRVLDPRPDLQSASEVGGYDSSTAQVFRDMGAMFTFSELTLTQRSSGEHFFRDADFDLRESIKYMLLHVFCARQRLVWYSTKSGDRYSPADIRTRCDILFLYEGIFDYGGHPVIAVTYLDMNDIKQSEVTNITRSTGRLIATEVKTQAASIAQARQARRSLPTDENIYDIKASMKELDLMRKLSGSE